MPHPFVLPSLGRMACPSSFLSFLAAGRDMTAPPLLLLFSFSFYLWVAGCPLLYFAPSLFLSLFLYAVLSFWGCPGCTPALRSERVWLSPTFRSFWGGVLAAFPHLPFFLGGVAVTFLYVFLSFWRWGGVVAPPPNHLVCSVWCLS